MLQAAALEAGLRSEDEPDTTYYTAAIYLVAAHLLGVIHNRKLRSNLFNHANLLYEHGENMATISEEVVNCQLLLENIFPQEVLQRLKQRDDGGGIGACRRQPPLPPGSATARQPGLRGREAAGLWAALRS